MQTHMAVEWGASRTTVLWITDVYAGAGARSPPVVVPCHPLAARSLEGARRPAGSKWTTTVV